MRSLRPLLGGTLTILCGIVLWSVPLGETWINTSYDYSFRFGARRVTNDVVLILMDNEAYDRLHQVRGQPWDRGLHARLLNKLADDGCPLVVMDSFFGELRVPDKDEALARAMRRQEHLVLMAKQARFNDAQIEGVRPLFPAKLFYDAAKTNSGIGWLDPDSDLIVRCHWPYPSGPYPSLAEAAARVEGARLAEIPRTPWLRYYGQDGQWAKLSYERALLQPKNYFHNRIVFVGNQPESSVSDREEDKFCTPYTRWTGEATGGVEIILTDFLNLVNNESLWRLPAWFEFLILVISGGLMGAGICRMRMLAALGVAALIGACTTIAGVSCGYFTNYWFPWLLIVGAQLPCALVFKIIIQNLPWFSERQRVRESESMVAPVIPGYDLIEPPFGEGAYGKVWLARNRTGQWHAVKVIYLANFNDDPAPYEREFAGVTRYAPISDKHPGLLKVIFVSEKLEDHFHYIMELGDSLEADWAERPSKYKPRDLAGERARAKNQRLSLQECLRIGLALTDALDFLHKNGLTHRDIKPQNVIFVNSQPKLADLGLIAEIRPPDQERTSVGTPGYMPPPPELPGTPQADIYAMGIMLYVLSTGRGAALFPELATTLAGSEELEGYLFLNDIIRKACQPDPTQRYESALQMRDALQQAQKDLQARNL